MVKNKKTKLSAAPYDEKKMELLAECTKLMREKPEEQQKCSKFAAFIDEKLESFDKGRRSYAEKRIYDIIFELEFATNYPNYNPQVRPPPPPPPPQHHYEGQASQHNSYVELLNFP